MGEVCFVALFVQHTLIAKRGLGDVVHTEIGQEQKLNLCGESGEVSTNHTLVVRIELEVQKGGLAELNGGVRALSTRRIHHRGEILGRVISVGIEIQGLESTPPVPSEPSASMGVVRVRSTSAAGVDLVNWGGVMFWLPQSPNAASIDAVEAILIALSVRCMLSLQGEGKGEVMVGEQASDSE
eukprot:5738538-Amphidinium_carterae.3